MKKQLLSIINRFSRFIYLPAMIQLSGQRLFLPFYHSVQGDEPLPHLKHLYPVRKIETFIEDLEYLLQYFEPIDLQQLKSIVLDGKTPVQNYMHLSFDDGLREVYEIVLPILEKKGIPASIFVNSDFVDNKSLLYRFKVSLIIEYLEQKKISKAQKNAIQSALTSRFPLTKAPTDFTSLMLNLEYEDQGLIQQLADILEYDFQAFLRIQQPYLSSNQIRDTLHRGFTIGAHSQDHPLYKNLSLDEQVEQTAASIDYLQDTFNVSDSIFSFPFTDDGVERSFFEVIQKEAIASLTFGCAGLKQEDFPFHLQRFPMETTALQADKLVNTEYFYYLSKAPFGKNKMVRN